MFTLLAHACTLSEFTRTLDDVCVRSELGSASCVPCVLRALGLRCVCVAVCVCVCVCVRVTAPVCPLCVRVCSLYIRSFGSLNDMWSYCDDDDNDRDDNDDDDDMTRDTHMK